MNAGEVPTSLTSTQKITGESPNLSQDLSRSIPKCDTSHQRHGCHLINKSISALVVKDYRQVLFLHQTKTTEAMRLFDTVKSAQAAPTPIYLQVRNPITKRIIIYNRSLGFPRPSDCTPPA